MWVYKVTGRAQSPMNACASEIMAGLSHWIEIWV